MYSFVINKARGGTPGKPGPPIQLNVDGQLVLVYEVTETDVGPADEFALECLPVVGRVTLYESQITGFGAHKPEFGTASGFAPATLDYITETMAFGTPRIREVAPLIYTSPAGRLVVRSRASGVGLLSIVHRITIMEGHEGQSERTDATSAFPLELRFTHPTFGEDLNVDGQYSGTPVLVYDGDTAAPPAWTPTNVLGAGVNFASATRPFPPSLVSAEVFATTGNIWELDFGAAFDLSVRHALSMEVNVASNWTALDTFVVYGWDSGTASMVGNSVSLADFFDESITDTWMSISIDLGLMGLETSSVTGFRMEVTARNGPRALWYFDAWFVQESGGPIAFEIVAPPATVVEVLSLIFVLADVTSTAEVDGTMYGLAWDQVLALARLPNGILVQLLAGGVPTPVQTLFSDLSDLFGLDATIEDAVAKDGEACVKITLDFDEPPVLFGVPGSSMTVSVNDDLTGLLLARARAVCRLRV